MDKQALDKANGELKQELEKVLGPKMPGVAGFGPRLDTISREVGLTVLVKGALKQRLNDALPSSIDGLPVRIAVAGTGRLE
jgi:hypothetical protein